MQPICTDQGLQFTALNTPQTAPNGNNYDCLSTQPDPTWYYLKISNTSQVNGDLYMDLSASQDIDFIIYGPFQNLALAQSSCASLGVGNSSFNTVKDCSYSGTNLEKPHLSGVQPYEIYVMLITNYAQIQQTVSLLLIEPDSTAFTDCSIITPKPSEMPTSHPTIPTQHPTAAPSIAPSVAPSSVPSLAPSSAPSVAPSSPPTAAPSSTSSIAPSFSPIADPTTPPIIDTTVDPTVDPIRNQSTNSTRYPSVTQTKTPTTKTKTPTSATTNIPTQRSMNLTTTIPTDTAPSLDGSVCADTYINIQTCEQITTWECDLNYYITLCPKSCGYCIDNGTFCAHTSFFTFTPQSGTALGGNEVFINSPCFNDTNRQKMYCSFGTNLVRGIQINSTTFMCIVPAQRSNSDVQFRVKFGNEYFQKGYRYSYADYCSATAIINGFGVQYTDPFVLSVSSNSNRMITWNPNDFAGDLVAIYGRIWLHELECYMDGIVDVIDNNGSYQVAMPDPDSNTLAGYQQQLQIKFWLENTESNSRRLIESVAPGHPTSDPTISPTNTPCTDTSFPAIKLTATSKYDGLNMYSDPNNMKVCIFSAQEVGLKTKLSKNFMVEDFVSHDGADGFRLSPKLVECLQSVHDELNVPITVTSGYRTVTYNTKKGYAENSRHLSGTAADLWIDPNISGDVLKLAKSVICNCRRLFELNGMSTGLGLGGTFVHVDMRKSYAYWAKNWYPESQYTKEQWGEFIRKYSNTQMCDPLAQFSSNADPRIMWEAEQLRLETAQTVQNIREQKNNPSLTGSHLDAFRYCHWSCSIAKKFGTDGAKMATTNYEKYKQPCSVTRMHLTNNQHGRNIATEKQDCSEGCVEAVIAGTLQTNPTSTSGCALQPVTGFQIADSIWYSTAPTCIDDGSDTRCDLPNDRDKPASAATTFGDPHYISFDELEFDFQGIGVYELIVIEESNFVIQSLNERIVANLGVSVVTGIAVKQYNYPIISIINDINNSNTLSIWYDDEEITLPPSNEQQNYQYFTLTYTPSRVTLNLYVGITISLTNNYGLAVSISCFLKNSTKGLLGNFDGDLNNDFTSKNGTIIPITSSEYDIYHSFGITWRVNKTSDILIPTQYYMYTLLDSTNYEPVLDLNILTLDPMFIEAAERVCNGNEACLFDVIATQNLNIANSTLQSLKEFETLKQLINGSDFLCTPICQNNGKCIQDGICECDQLYFGERCENIFHFNKTSMMQTTEYSSFSSIVSTQTIYGSDQDDDDDDDDDDDVLFISIIIVLCLLFCCCLIICIGRKCKDDTAHRKIDNEIEMDEWNDTESMGILTTNI